MPFHILWPILASITAVALHWFVNVPSRPYQERKPPSRATAPKPKAKAPPAIPRFRSPTQLRLLHNHWTSQPFADEPENKQFRSRHETALRNLIVEIRNSSKVDFKLSKFEATVQCKTVRCQFEICGTNKPLKTFLTHLKNAQVDGKSIWRDFVEAKSVPEKNRSNSEDKKVGALCSSFLVSLNRDLGPNDSVTLRK